MSFAKAATATRRRPWALRLGKQAVFEYWNDFATRRYTGEMDFKLVPRTIILALAGASLSISAWAQWQWIDKDGRKVFSDRPPPASIQDKDILKRAAADNRPAAVPVAAKASVPQLLGKDAALEARKKQAEDAEAASKKTEEEKIAKARAENCDRAKRGLASFESGVRIAVTNARGEREVMDDAARAVETKRLQAIASSDCKI